MSAAYTPFGAVMLTIIAYKIDFGKAFNGTTA
jgi:hypothetical protein